MTGTEEAKTRPKRAAQGLLLMALVCVGGVRSAVGQQIDTVAIQFDFNFNTSCDPQDLGPTVQPAHLQVTGWTFRNLACGQTQGALRIGGFSQMQSVSSQSWAGFRVIPQPGYRFRLVPNSLKYRADTKGAVPYFSSSVLNGALDGGWANDTLEVRLHGSGCHSGSFELCRVDLYEYTVQVEVTGGGLLKPSATIPAERALVQTDPVTLAWEPVPDAARYEVELFRMAFGQKQVLRTLMVGAEPRVVIDGYCCTAVAWRVRALRDGETGPWSSARVFGYADFLPALPEASTRPTHANGMFRLFARYTSPYVAWAKRFRVQVSASPGFESPLIDSTLASYERTYTTPWTSGPVYYRVGSENDYGVRWAPTQRFVVYLPVAPPAPAVVDPDSGATVLTTQPRLTWRAAPNATSYVAELSTDPTFAQVNVRRAGVLDTFLVGPPLTRGTTYYWRVLARNQYGDSPWTPVESFHVSAETDAESTPQGAPLAVEVQPNPARGPVQIALTLDRAEPVKIEVFDAAGRRVAVIAARELPLGRSTYRWEAAGWPPGVYFVRTTRGSEMLTRAVTLTH